MNVPDYVGVPLTEGEYAPPADMNVATLSPAAVYQLLVGPVSRGYGLSRVACVGGLLALVTGLALAILPLGIAGGMVALGAGIAVLQFRKKVALARRIVDKPSLVQWGHPPLLCPDGDITRYTTMYMTLHLDSGQKFEIGMSREYLAAVFLWLRRNHPGIRLNGRLPDAH